MDISFRWMVLEGLYSQRLSQILQAISQIGICGPDFYRFEGVPRTPQTGSLLSSLRLENPKYILRPRTKTHQAGLTSPLAIVA